MTSLLRRREAREGGYSLELPISKQFTPQQIPSLRELLQLVHDHGPASGGDLDAARRAVKKRFFAAQRRGGSEAKRITMAGNAIGSARHWGLLDDDLELTATGRAALAAPDEDGAVRILV